MCLLVSNQGFTPMLFSAKELKNHVIYTYTSVCIENVCTSGEDGLPTRWGLLIQEMLRVRPVASHSLSPQGVKPQPVRLKSECTQEQTGGCRAAPARSSSCPSSHGCQLRPTAQMRGKGEGRREELPTMACRNTKTNWERKDTCTRTDCTRTGMR